MWIQSPVQVQSESFESNVKVRRRAILIPPEHVPPRETVVRPGRIGGYRLLSGSTGSITAECAACATTLARGLHPHDRDAMVVECPRCGRLNLVRV